MNAQKLAGLAMVAVAVIGFALQVLGTLELTGLPEQILVSIEFLLATLGIRAVIDETAETVFQAIFDFRSKTLLGGILTRVLAPFVDPSLVPNFPDGPAIEIIGTILVIIGLVDAAGRGNVLNTGQRKVLK